MYKPPTLAQIARHLGQDAGLRPSSGNAWAPSSVRALVARAQQEYLLNPVTLRDNPPPPTGPGAAGRNRP
jgi:hypothetical protein